MKQVEIIDKWNANKVWLIKMYADGHYYINQRIGGRVFYKKYTRTTKRHINQILEQCGV